MPELRQQNDRDEDQREGAANLSHYMSSPRFADHLKRILPEHLDSDRFYTIALRQLEAVPDLALCSLRSVAGGILQAATLGLEIGTMGESWLIPYEQPRGSGDYTAQLQIGYLGYLALGWRSRQIAGLQVDVVMPGDAFEYQKGTNGYIHHKPQRGRLRGPDLEYAYAVIQTVHGSHVWDVFSREDVERIRNSGPSGNSPAWLNWYPEMAIGKVLKSTLKFAPKSRELARAIALDDEADAGLAQGFDFDVPLLEAETTRAPRQKAAQATADAARAATEARSEEPGDAAEPEPREPETVVVRQPAPAAAKPAAAARTAPAARPPARAKPDGGLGW